MSQGYGTSGYLEKSNDVQESEGAQSINLLSALHSQLSMQEDILLRIWQRCNDINGNPPAPETPGISKGGPEPFSFTDKLEELISRAERNTDKIRAINEQLARFV